MPDARFCHSCGLTIGCEASSVIASAGSARPILRASKPWTPALRWALPIVGFAALLALSAIQLSREAKDDPDGTLAAMSLPGAAGGGGGVAPDISSMSPQERADRLFNRVMSLSGDGKADSAAFFAPMAIAALESLQPPTAHSHYDIGLVALAAGDHPRAAAQADAILAQRPTHLLGLTLAARAADARGDAAASRSFQQRLLAAERSELDEPLQEYSDHGTDILDAVAGARSR